ncbi:MAG: class I SAM-dependent methyltransferase [Bacilli bacterium]|nr:class I SAM-dependent methyltransferase [Bacilli bacterium]
MKTFNEMWEELSPFLSVGKGLDEGYADGKYTRFFAKYCKHIDGIDISEDFYNQAKENLKDVSNVNLQIADAAKTPFEDKSYDVILCTSFHEFDLSGKDKFSMNLNLKTDILKEMIRLSNTIVFAEISPTNISGELYKVFNPIEDHSFRTEVSNLLIDKVLRDNGYKRLIEDYAVDEIQYNNREEFLEDMMGWWAEVKVPSDNAEKEAMKKQIAKILETENMLTDLTFHDIFRYTVYKKEE